MAKISLTRALVTRKNLDSKIASAIGSFMFCDIAIGKTKIPNNKNFDTAEKFNDRCKADVQAFNDLIKRRADINEAILRANAITMVKIGNVEMTIAAAIDMKKIIEFKRTAYDRLSHQLRNATNTMMQKELEIQQTAEQRTNNMLGKDQKNTDMFKSQMEMILPMLKDQMQPHLIGYPNAEEFLKKMSDEISDFVANVDFALSEINARTEIEIQD